MLKKITSLEITREKNTQTFYIDPPSICPHCGFAIVPMILTSHFLDLTNSKRKENNYYRIFVEYLCPKCLKIAVSEYHYGGDLIDANYESTFLNATYPILHNKAEHSEEICKLSPKYEKIYNEAHYAEEKGLTEICGMGYRKALEFLIKDYAIKLNPDKSEDIKSKPLAQCIKEFIDNKRIKSLATASAWIGNDETHYVRKHDDYDLASLKAFINSMESYINSELEAIKADTLLKTSK